MKHIGIFGDSFGVEAPLYRHLGKHSNEDKIGKSWVSYYKELVPNATITSHALQGSCLYYSYEKFLNHRHKYDIIIFIFTSVGRVTKILDDGRELSCVNIEHAHRGMKNYPKSSVEFRYYAAMENYFLYIQDDTKDKILWNLMHKEITSYSNVFSIRAFGDDNSLIRIHRAEDNVASDGMYFEERYNSGILDIRFNHITDNNNEILANDINEQMKSGKTEFSLDLEKYKFEREHVDKFMVPMSMIKK